MNGSKGSPPTDISSKDETFSQSHQQQQLLPPVSQGNTEDDGIFLRRLRGESEQQQQGAATTAPALPPQSTTTASFKPPAIANHNRTVSWGVASTPPIPPLPSYDGPASDKIETIGINTILAAGPSESEAETYILQAVEKVANRAHQRTHTETDRLLAAIAEEEIKKSMEMENVEEEEEEEEEQDTKEEPDKHPPIMQKQPSHSTLNSSNYRFQNLVNKQIKASTVEGNLFNLTSALAELDGGGSKHSRKDSHSFEITFTAADKLNNAANQMLHGKQQDTTDTIEEETDDLESQPSSRGEALAALEGDIPVEEGGGGGAAGRGATETNSQRKRSSSKRKSGGRRAAKAVKQGAKEEWELFNSFIGQRKAYMKAYAKKIIMSLFLPCLGMAIFLFYLIEHPEQCLDQLANNNTETLATEAPSLNDTMAPLIASSSNATRPPKDSLGDLFTCSSIGSASASWWFLYCKSSFVVFALDCYLLCSSRLSYISRTLY